jgi:hypothetical protein
MPSIIFDSYIRDHNEGKIDWSVDTFYGMLVTSAYTPNKATHSKRSDVTNEVTGTGYTAGGAAVSVTRNLDTTNHRYDLTPGNVSWPSSTITARAMVIYKRRGGAASADELVAYMDFSVDVASTASTFQATPTGPLREQN